MKFEYKMRLLTNIKNAEISEISELLKLNKAGCAKSINGNLSINYSKDAFQRIISNQEITISRLNNKLIGYFLIGKNTNQENLHYQKIKAMEISKMLEIPICEIGYGCQIFIDPFFCAQDYCSKNYARISKIIIQCFCVQLTRKTATPRRCIKKLVGSFIKKVIFLIIIYIR